MGSKASAFEHDGLRFWYLEKGAGNAFVFQHGLGGDRRQGLELYAYRADVRILALDCRGHGKTQPLGDPQKLRFDILADDVVALLDHLGVEQFVAGGISMGAGVALNLALRYGQRVKGLVLVRPAWLSAPNPPNLDCMVEVGRLIRDHGPEEGKRLFGASALYREVAATAPYTADSLLGQFDEPRAADAWPRLLHMPADAPNRDPSEWEGITVPTLILANHVDPTHPFAYAQRLAAAIPHARLVEVPSKAVDKAGHVAAARREIGSFLDGTGG
jgi:pimeloyl-ACP methyl ester carboxylesterase